MASLSLLDRKRDCLTVSRGVVSGRGATVRKQLIARLLDPPDAFRRMPVSELARFREVMREALSGRGPEAARRGGSGRRT